MRRLISRFPTALFAFVLVSGLAACGDSAAESERGGQRPGGASGGGRPGGNGFGGGPPAAATAVPVEVAPVERRTVSEYIQANGTLEAENEVDLVARISGPIEQLRTEEGQIVQKGQLLARIDDDDVRAQAEIARVGLEEARLNFERAQKLFGEQLLSPEAFEQTKSRYDTAKAQFEGNQLLLGYTEIRAPFSGAIVARYVDLAQQVSPNTPLFRISDFDPLLCPVQVPERDLPKLAVGQDAYLTVEAWPGERFDAKVLRLSPVVNAATGTVKVTLDVDARDKLRPGMFARVFLETDTHENAMVIAKSALSLESLGDTVFVHENGAAQRRDVEIGFEEGDVVEVLSGVEVGEEVVVVGQDGLSDGTPIQVLGDPTAKSRVADGAGPAGSGPPGAGGFRAGGPPGGMPDPSQMSAEQLEQIKERMRQRGLTEEQIEERLQRMRQRSGGSGAGSNTTPTQQ